MDVLNEGLELNEMNEILIWCRFSSKVTVIFWFCFRSIILENVWVQCSLVEL